MVLSKSGENQCDLFTQETGCLSATFVFRRACAIITAVVLKVPTPLYGVSFMRTPGLPAALMVVLLGFVSVIVAEETEQHWSFQKPDSPAVPLKEHLQHAQRVHNPIDAFVLARLESHQLEPAPIADRQTLVRRAFFDLLGLPPSPEQLTAFLNDDSVHAWAELIDQLLKSKQYGERWGRHWLDVARYADSGGYETDMYYRNAWRYRDYVVKSFNDDKPYDRFVQEQIAGDEL